MLSPKVIFVEGPTAIGKGYFINTLASQIQDKQPNLRILKLETKHWALAGHAITEDRKYTAYKTDDDKISSIYLGHLSFIRYVIDVLTNDEADLIIADRSFLSFVNYNLLSHKHDSVRQTYIDCFRDSCIAMGLTDFPVLAVQLTTRLSEKESIDLLVSRIEDRGDGKEVDSQWLSTLLRTYGLYTTENVLLADHHETVTSGEASTLVDRYFQPTVGLTDDCSV